MAGASKLAGFQESQLDAVVLFGHGFDGQGGGASAHGGGSLEGLGDVGAQLVQNRALVVWNRKESFGVGGKVRIDAAPWRKEL